MCAGPRSARRLRAPASAASAPPAARAGRRPPPRAGVRRGAGPARPRPTRPRRRRAAAVGTGIGCDASLLAGPPPRLGSPRARLRRLLRVLDGTPADRPAHRARGRRTPSRRWAPACRRSGGPRRTATGSRRGTPGTSRSRGSWRSTLLAMVSTKASPRPMAPAGGATSSLFSIAASNSAHLARVDAVAERGVDDDGDDVVGVLLHEGEHGFVELLEARHRPPFGGEVRAVDDDVSWHTGLSVNHLDTANHGIAVPVERGAARRLPCRPVIRAPCCGTSAASS